MRNKRIFSTLVATMIAIAAMLLLITTLASAGPVADTAVSYQQGAEVARALEGQVLAPDEPLDAVQEPEWTKWIGERLWEPQMAVTVETSDTIEVIDVITTLPFDPLVLVETWDPDYLELLDYQVQPGGSLVTIDDGTLEWDLPESYPPVFTLTKWFHVKPSTWRETILNETLLDVTGQPWELRPVVIAKEAPVLWIDSAYDPLVLPGEVATFKLSYGNKGGYENAVTIRNDFPTTAPFAWSDPPPDDLTPDRLSALWQVGDLARDQMGEIVVGVAIAETAQPSTTIEIWDWIFDHTGEEPLAEVVTSFHVEPPLDVQWAKLVNGIEWNPDLVITAPTSETIEVLDVVESGLPFTLTEFWNPGHLTLLDYQPTAGQVFTTAGSLEWVVENPPPTGEPVFLTKRFHVGPGPWDLTVLEELLRVARAPEPLVRMLPIEHPYPPITFPGGDWPWYAQGEIFVHPEPPMVGEPTELCAEVVNHDLEHPHDVTIEFAVANFGIGLPFHPVGHTTVEVPPGGHAVGCTMWVPPTADHWCIEARLITEDKPYAFSQRNVDVDEPLAAETPHARTIPVRNPFTEPVTIALGLIRHLPNWEVSLSPDLLRDVAPRETLSVTLTVTPPVDLPEDGQPIVDVEAYVGEKLIGGFRKIFRPPVILHPFPDPPYAEREITVHPYPAIAGEPTEVCVELRNPTPVPQVVEVQFSWANFGIGLPFTPINGPRVVHLPPFSVVNTCIHWIPPMSGHVCLQVELAMEGYKVQRSQLNIDVDEPLRPYVPHSRSFIVRNPFEDAADITLELKPHLPNWRFELSETGFRLPGLGEREVTLTVIPPADLPEDGHPIVDVEAFAHIGQERHLIGGFRKIFRPPIVLHPFPDPPYAEREISVHPDPPLAGRPTEVCVELRNPTPFPRDVEVQFSWANFGIGLPFTPINGPRVVHLPPFSIVKECIHWIPPVSGHVCIQVEMFLDGYDDVQRSQRNIDVDEPLEPNTAHSRVFEVGNPFEEPVTITLGLIPHFPDWGLEIQPDVLRNMGKGERRPVTLTVTPPNDLPHDGDPVVDVEAFADVGGEHHFIGGFRKTFRPPISIHRPQDPVYAESEIFVDPYPAIPGVPTTLGVEVFNPTDEDRIVKATFSVANFGIGLPFSTDDIVPNPTIRIFVPAHGAARGHVVWRPPFWKGKFCVRVTLEMEGHEPIWSQRNIDVGEPLRPGQPHQLVFRVGGWPYTEPVDIHLGLVNHRDRWRVSLSDTELQDVQPGQPVSVTLTVVPPPDARLGTGDPIVDVEAFVDGMIIGGFRKLDVPPIPIHKPHEKGYAESEIFIDPYPPTAGQTTRAGAVIQNSSEETLTVDLRFGWAKFGMGIEFSTTGMSPYTRTVTMGPEMTATAEVEWTPVLAGPQCVRIMLSDPDGTYEPQESMRNVDVVERPPCNFTQVFTLTVYNDSPFSATVDIGLLTFDVPADWEVTTVPSDTLELGPFSEGTIRVLVKIPCPGTPVAIMAQQEMLTLQQGAGAVPTIDVEGYIEGELVGGIELQFPDYARGLVLYLPVVLRNW